jgi:uncharacterized protein YjiS (DUF1127 family)
VIRSPIPINFADGVTAMPGTVLTRLHIPQLRPRGLLRRLAAADAAYRNRLRLAELDERMLRDIGVTRGEVARELRRPLDW